MKPPTFLRTFLSPLRGWSAFGWALLCWGVALGITFALWAPIFQYAPFMVLFAAVILTAFRSGPMLGIGVALAGLVAVLLHSPVLIARIWVPCLSLTLNTTITMALVAAIRRGIRESEEAHSFRESIDDAVADFLWSCRINGEPLAANDRMLEYLGVAREDMADKLWSDYVHPDDLVGLHPQFAEFASTGEKFSWTVRFRSHTGEYRWFQCRAVAIRDGAGQVDQWVGTSTDVHEQFLAEEQRVAALQREKTARLDAESANRMKDEFLATISHELRTPLNAVFGWLHLLKDPETTIKEFREGLEVIDRNAHAQGRLVNDLLDMSGMLTGKIWLKLESVDLAAIVRSSVDSVLPTAATKSIEVTLETEDQIGPVQGDVGRLQQIIWNLLTNATKFTPQGGRVAISLRKVDHSVELAVADSGEGIAPEFLGHVFERFRQADSSVTRRHGGLGLGLAITSQLVELHGGTIHAESDGIGLGATFRILLPLKPAGSPQKNPEPGSEGAQNNFLAFQGTKILVVDDDEDSRIIVSLILEKHGAQISTVTGVEAGLAVLQSTQEQPFAVVICDLAMPGLSGYDFVLRVRALPEKKYSQIPILALTAFGREEDKQRALDSGFNDYLSKPVEPHNLSAVIAALL